MRSLWSAHAVGALRHSAFALDAAVFDLAFITGPVLASALAAGVAPAAAVGVLLALTGAAVIIIGARPRPGDATQARRPADVSPPAPRAPASAAPPSPATNLAAPRLAARPSLAPDPAASPSAARHSAALWRLLLTGALVNLALSATEVALTGYVRQHHALWASGPLLAEVSVGSIAGSLLLGARASATEAADGARRLPRLLARYALGLAVLASAGLYAPLVAVAAPLAGLCLGPSLATLFGLASSTAPDGGGTETQSWLSSVMNGGAAAGAALAGATASQPVLSLALAAVAAAASSAVSTTLGRRRPTQESTSASAAGP
jgi:hypothetical protein